MAKKATTTKRTRKTKSESADYQELNLLTGERYVPKEETVDMDEYKIYFIIKQQSILIKK